MWSQEQEDARRPLGAEVVKGSRWWCSGAGPVIVLTAPERIPGGYAVDLECVNPLPNGVERYRFNGSLSSLREELNAVHDDSGEVGAWR